MNRAEILAPAGDEASARAAISSGADAVYLGLTRFSARESAANFDFSALAALARDARLVGVKIYVCLNTLVKDGELPAFFEAARRSYEAGADALLIQDLFLGRKLKERYPELTLHLSTQAGCCNERGARLAKEYGFSRVVLARETPLSEIERISPLLETEVFVQGALCTCFSGQCYLSSFAGNNSGNRGRCKQPCRKRYSIDRAGFEAPAYALSPSDLSVGKRIEELLSAGVVSLKIEGRMRRPEYVAAAVSYYRALLAGGEGKEEFTRLVRSFNRGDYTRGLAFGQEEDFLSRNVQGHIGERVGEIGARGLCVSSYPAGKGDGFKILRGGKEVGGALFRAAGEGGFYLSSSEKLLRGDEVRLTTDASLASLPLPERKREISLSLSFFAGEPAEVRCGDFVFRGAAPQRAERAPLTEEELVSCFKKTDGLPYAVSFRKIETRGAFLNKSALNAFRREFYLALTEHLLPSRALPAREREEPVLCGGEERCAAISRELFPCGADILIYKPRDYSALPERGTERVFLYLPPFLTTEEEKALYPALARFGGIYCDGYYGLSLARELHKPFFAGTGFNLTNRVSAAGVKEAGADFFALSKELSGEELCALTCEGAFALALGSVKVMDILYCPFSKNCKTCDRREFYRLRDEEGRVFPLRRYRMGGNCRFELFNCAPIRTEKTAGVLADFTAEQSGLSAHLKDPAHAPLDGATKGHFTRSIQ